MENFASWESLHGQWPAVIVQSLRKQLPVGYVAEPHVPSDAPVEVNVVSSARSDLPLATAAWSPTTATLAVETELPDFDEYEVRIYDAKRGRRLVAAIEIVSPANKDRFEHRNAFVGECAALLQIQDERLPAAAQAPKRLVRGPSAFVELAG